MPDYSEKEKEGCFPETENPRTSLQPVLHTEEIPKATDNRFFPFLNFWRRLQYAVMTDHDQKSDISCIIPAFNEGASLRQMCDEIFAAAPAWEGSFEVIIVDDGSTDNTSEVIGELAHDHSEVRGVQLDANRGKAAAIAAGFRASTGRIILTMDADLQDDPAAADRFLSKINEGFDVVCGWKKPRYDPPLRRLSSALFNAAAGALFGPRLHDHNCGFKAFRREVLETISLYGDLHRFATFLAHAHGFRVTEVVVPHRRRKFGASRYGVERIWRSFFDLFTVSMTIQRAQRGRRTFRFFAATGIPLATAGLAVCFIMLLAAPENPLTHMPFFLSGILAFLIGVQFLAAGLLGEFILSILNLAQQKRSRQNSRTQNRVSILLKPFDLQKAQRIERAVSEGSAVSCEFIAPRKVHVSSSDKNAATEVPFAEAPTGAVFLLAHPSSDPEALLALYRQLKEPAPGRLPARAGSVLHASAALTEAAGPATLLNDFPGMPGSVGELAAWCRARGYRILRSSGNGTAVRTTRFLFSTFLHLPLFFLGRYHARPLHFFGSLGGIATITGVAAGVAVKLSSLSGAPRYFLMELCLGLAVAGIELFVAGLLGELLASVYTSLSEQKEMQ